MQEASENTYILDADSATEMARLLGQDFLLTRAMGGPLAELPDLSPVHDILDLACGPGGWALDVAYTYPNKEVTGVDISQQMIRYARAQAHARGQHNAHFRVMDLLTPLDIPDQSVDLVNARFLVGFMPASAWPALLHECTRIVRPGGFIRLTEPERSISTSPSLSRFETLVTTGLRQIGQSVSVEDSLYGLLPLLGHFLRQAGCTVIADRAHILEYWPGHPFFDSGYQNYRVLLSTIQPFLLKTGLASHEELEQLYQQAMTDMLQPHFCAVSLIRTVTGQKAA